jgi:hypothetical protein
MTAEGMVGGTYLFFSKLPFFTYPHKLQNLIFNLSGLKLYAPPKNLEDKGKTNVGRPLDTPCTSCSVRLIHLLAEDMIMYTGIFLWLTAKLSAKGLGITDFENWSI